MNMQMVGKSTLLMLLASSSIWAVSTQVVKTKDWGSGFCADVIVSNDTSISQDWNVSFDAQGIITTLWNAQYTQDVNTLETKASGVSWNKTVGANQTRSFGYCANVKPSSAGELKVTQTQEDKWDGGFCNRVTVSNLTAHDLDWKINFPVKGTIFTLWNAKYVQNAQDLNTDAEGTWSSNVVKANDSISFGYCADSPVVQVVDVPVVTSEVMNALDAFVLDIFSAFDVGFGGGYSIPFASNVANEKIWVSSVNLVLDSAIGSNSYYSNIKNFDAGAFDTLQQSLKNSKFLVYWLTDSWNESWFSVDKIQQAIDAGYVPVFNYWYFGDRLDGIPSAAQQQKYADDNKRLATFLNKLKGTRFLILEPEFNKRSIISSVDNQHQFASILGNAIDTIKANTTDVYFSLAMTDTGSRGVYNLADKCGYSTCALGDKYEWGRPSTIYNDLLPKLDFISFQEMIAQFSRDPSNSGTWDNPIPIAYSNDDIGVDYLAQRVTNFAFFLKEKYNKPVFLPYIAIATASWTDTNANQKVEEFEIDSIGWEVEANKVYEDLASRKDELQANGLFGFALMALFDNPQHDAGGYQYFMQNEYHFGALKSSAQSGVDIASFGNIQEKGNIINSVFGVTP